MAQQENPREEEPVTTNLSASSASPRENNPKPDPFAKFGPPKDFAYPPHIAELMPNRYPWRKELKEQHRTPKAQFLSNSASPRESYTKSPESEEPAYHQRE